MKKLDHDTLKRIILQTLNESAGSADTKEIWYVKKTNGGVRNISTSRKDADDFLWKALKGDGDVYYAEVPLADWSSEKVNASNIERYARKLYRENSGRGILNEAALDDFFQFLDADPKKGSFVYAYYTCPVIMNKTYIDEDGEKKPNDLYGRLYKSIRYKFNFGQVYANAMKKHDSEYTPGKRSGSFTKDADYSVVEHGKSGKYIPIIPIEQPSQYAILNDDGTYELKEKDEIRKYLKTYNSAQPSVAFRPLILDRVYRLSGGGNVWTNPDFLYEYFGPGS